MEDITMKKRYYTPEFQIIQIDMSLPVLTMSISDVETGTQFAPEMEYDFLFDDFSIVL